MENSDEQYYSQYAADEERRQRPPQVSRTILVGIAVIILSLGFMLGSYTSDLLSPSSNEPPLYDEVMVTRIFEEASPAVVELSVTRHIGRRQMASTGTGSGFIIDSRGHIITNQHVVDQAEDIFVKLYDERTVEATLLGASQADDLALLQVDPEAVAHIDPLPLADSANVEPGQMAIAIGSPFRNFNSITVGVVSGTGRGPASELRRPIPNMIQTDAALNPGNSGGPLLNSRGQAIGVNSAVRTGSLNGIGDYRIGFAVPSNTVRNLMPELLKGEEIRRPWLGIGGEAIPQSMADLIGISRGVVVATVSSDSPADQAGLQPFSSIDERGDVITAIDGVPVNSVEDMVSLFNQRKPGDTVTLSVFRDGRTVELEVTLGEWPDT